MVGPGLAHEVIDGLRHLAAIQSCRQLHCHAHAGGFKPLLATLDLGRTTLGNLDAALVLAQEITELFLQGQEDGEVFVEFRSQPLDHFLHLGHQGAFGRAFAAVAFTGFGQHVEQAPRRVRLLHEHAPVQQGHLDEGYDQAADQFARTAFQVTLVQHHVEQHADQVDGVFVHRG